MKVIPKSLRSSLIVILHFGIILIFSSCSKSNSVKYSAIQVIHASPGLSSIDFYLNSYKINGDRNVNYNDTIGYRIFPAELATLVIKRHFSSLEYINQQIAFEKDNYYSLFVTGKSDSVTWLVTCDTTDIPLPGKSKIRFIQLSPDSPPLDLKLNAASIFTSQAFKTVSKFATIDPAAYTIELFKSGTLTSLFQGPLKIEAGKAYTIWSKGLITSPVDSLKLGIGMIAN